MNERIKELIEKATVRREEYLPGNDGHPTPTSYFDKEKFAELIVSECATVGFEAVANGDLVEDSILTHFGVES